MLNNHQNLGNGGAFYIPSGWSEEYLKVLCHMDAVKHILAWNGTCLLTIRSPKNDKNTTALLSI
jgi:hypothetical protein